MGLLGALGDMAVDKVKETVPQGIQNAIKFIYQGRINANNNAINNANQYQTMTPTPTPTIQAKPKHNQNDINDIRKRLNAKRLTVEESLRLSRDENGI